MTAIMDGTYEQDEEIKIEIMNAIAEWFYIKVRKTINQHISKNQNPLVKW